MRLAFAFVTMLMLVVVGCSNEVKGEAKPHACADTFAGEFAARYDAVGPAERDGKVCSDLPTAFETTISINDALTSMTITFEEGGSYPLTVGAETSLLKPCDYLGGWFVEETEAGTETTVIEILPQKDGSLIARTALTRYASDDYASSGADAAPICSNAFATTLTRL